MKHHIYFYGVLVLAYLGFNFFLHPEDDRLNTAINIVFASIIFLYISYMAFVLMKRMKKGK